MSKKQFRSQASSSRAFSGAFSAQNGFSGAGSSGSVAGFGAVSASPLSYVYEPPDLSKISQPDVVVAFKNVQKKDGTTKAKALEDIQAYVLSLIAEKGGLEDSIVEAWIKLYPRISIDSSRRVRQLAHTVQGSISLSCGKRIAKYMPRILGAWLAGLHDNDRLVTRAANEAFTQVFPGDGGKQKTVWKVYQSSILEYCKDAILKESVRTLSDERTTSPDDAEAKYARVVGSAMLVVTNLLDTLIFEEIEKQRTSYVDLLNEHGVWKLSSHSDSFVRKAVYRLLAAVLGKTQQNFIDLGTIGTHLLVEALHIDQTGSSYEYVKTLAQLSSTSPEVWTNYYAGSAKKSAIKRLCQFLRKGSQGGPPDFWVQVTALLQHIPFTVLVPEHEVPDNNLTPASIGSISPVLEALHDGITRKDEHRAGQSEAWRAYLQVAELLQPSKSSPEPLRMFLETLVVPIIDQHIRPNSENVGWTVAGPNQQRICVNAVYLVFRTSPELFEATWKRISAAVIQDFQTSLPEQSKDYAKSQDSIVLEVKRWYSFQAVFITKEDIMSIHPLLVSICSNELRSAIETTTSRNGKPYSAAAALAYAVRLLPDLTLHQHDTEQLLVRFAQQNVPTLLLSPSSPYLISFLDYMGTSQDIQDVYERAAESLVAAPDSIIKSKALEKLVASPWLNRGKMSNVLASTIVSSLRQSLEGGSGSWSLISESMGNHSAPFDLTDQMLARMTESLSIDHQAAAGLHGIGLAVKHNEKAVRDFTTSSNGSKLLSRLLFLVESPNDAIAQKAQQLQVVIQDIVSGNLDSKTAHRAIIEIIDDGLSTADSTSLSIESLVEQAENILRQTNEDNRARISGELLPNTEQWTAALEPFVKAIPNVSLAITNILGGAVYLVNQLPEPQITSETTISYDNDGYSPALRMAWYTTKLINATGISSNVTTQDRSVICRYLALFVQVASDNMSIPRPISLWEHQGFDVEANVIDMIAEAQNLLASWLRISATPEDSHVLVALSLLLDNSTGTSAASYYCGRASAALSAEYREFHGGTTTSKDEARLKTLPKTSEVISGAAFVAGVADSEGLLRLCNHYIANLTGLPLYNDPHDSLQQLILLNCAIQRREGVIQEIPQQRIVFYVKHVVDHLKQARLSASFNAEAFKSLITMVPYIKDIYGSLWANLVNVMLGEWAQLAAFMDEEIPSVHASLRLCAILHVLAAKDSNDDLVDCWTEQQTAIIDGLLDLMKTLSNHADESHQPRKIVNELLARQLSKMSRGHTTAQQELYPILACDSIALQQAAYGLLHQQIPLSQEQVSLDAALSKSYISKLPEELLSLILAAPSPESVDTANFHRGMPLPLRTYLLSWSLLFDHWTNASYKVQTDYAVSLKEGTYLKDFLDFTFQLLIVGRPRPVDPSSFDIASYTPDVEDSPEKDTQWLLVHLYYLCLKHLPSLSKNWWRDECSRHLLRPVEAWTEKFISLLVVQAELSTVISWLPTQESDDQPLEVKVSPKAREITASYPIDDQTMSIVIRLPTTYPLHPVSVESVHRVGVDEKKWRSWLIITQGVINFSSSSGSIVDGLIAWRKNVVGALKGQSECAICYSVVSADKQLPTKQCGTCKNSFHSSCLFRWFKSSNSSSCPLCRNSFNYG